MKRTVDFMKKILPADRWKMLLVAMAVGEGTFFLSRLFTKQLPHYNLQLPFETCIPLIPWTVSIYFGCYLVWGINYLIAFRQQRERALRFGSADLVAKLVALVFFLFLPTTLERPQIVGDGVWENVMRFLYWVDTPDNLFPSMHCMKIWACYIAVRDNDRVPVWYRLFSLLMAFAVFAVTLTTKQHVFVDVVAGAVLMEITYQLAGKYHWDRWYAKLFR